ncbi:MAG: phage tail protein, partial [Oscillospiraceae bacterium]|nr:phage tail protein [Oscillospiraceae bacterium]
MANLGVHIYEQATSISTPLVADSGIPFVVGLAPSHAAASPGKAYTPILCTSWKEAVEKLGFSYDWDTYTLCEFMYSHFQLFGCQPVIFCNVFDHTKMQKAGE